LFIFSGYYFILIISNVAGLSIKHFCNKKPRRLPGLLNSIIKITALQAPTRVCMPPPIII